MALDHRRIHLPVPDPGDEPVVEWPAAVPECGRNVRRARVSGDVHDRTRTADGRTGDGDRVNAMRGGTSCAVVDSTLAHCRGNWRVHLSADLAADHTNRRADCWRHVSRARTSASADIRSWTACWPRLADAAASHTTSVDGAQGLHCDQHPGSRSRRVRRMGTLTRSPSTSNFQLPTPNHLQLPIPKLNVIGSWELNFGSGW